MCWNEKRLETRSMAREREASEYYRMVWEVFSMQYVNGVIIRSPSNEREPGRVPYVEVERGER